MILVYEFSLSKLVFECKAEHSSLEVMSYYRPLPSFSSVFDSCKGLCFVYLLAPMVLVTLLAFGLRKRGNVSVCKNLLDLILIYEMTKKKKK